MSIKDILQGMETAIQDLIGIYESEGQDAFSSAAKVFISSLDESEIKKELTSLGIDDSTLSLLVTKTKKLKLIPIRPTTIEDILEKIIELGNFTKDSILAKLG